MKAVSDAILTGREIIKNRASVLYQRKLIRRYNELAARIDSEVGRNATLLHEALQLDNSPSTRDRAWSLATCFGDKIEVIEFLAFLRRNHLDEVFAVRLASDEMFPLNGLFWDTVTPLLEYGRLIVNGICEDPQHVLRFKLEDAAIALYYATIIVPHAPGPWLSLTILHCYQIGPCPYRSTRVTDARDHASEGIRAAEQFLALHQGTLDTLTRTVIVALVDELRKLQDGQLKATAAIAIEKGAVRIL